jgi:hypothetical protein
MRRRSRILIILGCSLVILVPALYGGYKWFYPRWHVRWTEEALRNLHIALETHYLKTDRYPNPLNAKGRKIGLGEEGYAIGSAPFNLLPEQRFYSRTRLKARETYYATDGTSWWLLWNPLLGRKPEAEFRQYAKESGGDWQAYHQAHPDQFILYDPTNGTSSRGCIFRTGP